MWHYVHHTPDEKQKLAVIYWHNTVIAVMNSSEAKFRAHMPISYVQNDADTLLQYPLDMRSPTFIASHSPDLHRSCLDRIAWPRWGGSFQSSHRLTTYFLSLYLYFSMFCKPIYKKRKIHWFLFFHFQISHIELLLCKIKRIVYTNINSIE